MKSAITHVWLIATLFVAVAISCALFSCNVTPIGGDGVQRFRLAGAVVIDPNKGSTTIGVDFLRDGLASPRAALIFAGDTLMYNWPGFPVPQAFSQFYTSASRYTVGSHTLLVIDSTLLNDSVITVVTDTFSITDVVPTNRLVLGNHNVTIGWDGSALAQGYVMATVLRQNAYEGTGYSRYVTTGATAGTFPPDAFSLSPGTLPDTGWYYLYVYSYSGAPDSALTNLALPVPFPSTLPDNISKGTTGGRFGIVRVTDFDSVHVVFQP